MGGPWVVGHPCGVISSGASDNQSGVGHTGVVSPSLSPPFLFSTFSPFTLTSGRHVLLSLIGILAWQEMRAYTLVGKGCSFICWATLRKNNLTDYSKLGLS